MLRNDKLKLYKSLKSLLNEQKCLKQTAFRIMRLVYATFHNPYWQIATVWDVDDVYSVRPELNHDQAMKVLLEIISNHDTEIGINWEVLENTADYLYPKSGSEHHDIDTQEWECI